MTIQEIEKDLLDAADSFRNYCSSLTDQEFFYQPEGKWSPAQQVKHLVTAANRTRLAFALPKFLARWVGGKPNRTSRTYEELVAKYQLKLEQGGKASGAYIPKPIPAGYGKEKLLNHFTLATTRVAKTIPGNWNETNLDEYLVPHPLLGKITLRELGYFTIYHTKHHLNSIRKMTGDRNTA